MRRTRFQLARFFCLLAELILPDGDGRTYVKLVDLNLRLKAACQREMER